MRIRKLLLLTALPMMCLGLSAQEKGPQKGDFTVALTLGYNASVMQNAAAGKRLQHRGGFHQLERQEVDCRDRGRLVLP